MKNVTYINAGAGSGKTYTLTQELVSLIKAHKAKPEQVILTTFTIKAAEEFKEKAKAELYKAGLFEEAIRLDYALIGTVHSVCQRMIAKYWFLLGLAPDMGVMAEEDACFYMSQSLAGLPTDGELAELHSFARNMDIRKKDGGMITSWINNDFWQEDLKNIIAYTVNYEIANYQKSEEESVAFIAQFVDPSLQLSYTTKELKAILDEHRDFLNQQRASAANDKRLAILDELYRGYRKPSVAWFYKAGEMMQTLKKCGPLAAEFREKAVRVWNSKFLFDEQTKYIHLIFELAKRWRDNYARFKQEKNLLDFDDMEKYMHLLMENPMVAQEIAKSFRFLFVDEFQDCSPIQVKIFDALSDLMEASYWVGDYKQAIYGFRGSDIKMVKAVVDRISGKKDGCDTRTLDTSWRSLPAIVDLDNHIFLKTFEGVLDGGNVALKCHRTQPDAIEERAVSMDDFYSLRYFRSTDELGVPAHIAKLMKSGVSPHDIGVLARTNGELDEVASILKTDYGISVNRGNTPVVLSKTYLLVESLLYVLNSCHDHLAKAKVAWIVEPGLKVSDLIERRLTEEDYLQDVPIIKHLLRMKNRLMQQSIASLVESMIIELNLFDVVKSIASDHGSGVSNLQIIISTAKTYEDHCVQMNLPATIDGFISYITTTNPVGSGDVNGVQLYTYHSCKGLEQKYVILMSLNNDVANDAKIIYYEVYGVHALHVCEPNVDHLYPEVYVRVVPWIYGSKKNVPECISERMKETDSFQTVKASALAEANRLLYVGMTRPRDVLLLQINPPKKGKKPLQWIESEGYTDISAQPENGDWDIFKTGCYFADYTITSEERDMMAEGGLDKGEAPTRLLLPVDVGELMDEECPLPLPRYVSPSSIKRKGNVVDYVDFAQRISFATQPSDMAQVGDCIHQVYSYIEDGDDEGLAGKIAETICQYGLSSVLDNPLEVLAAWHRLITYLTDKFGSALKVYHERPFWLEKDGQTFVGSIDLVWKTSEGSVVIDYKTCPMGVKAVLQADSDHYAGWYVGQLDAYTDALETSGEKVLKRYIYYPVSGILAEIAEKNI